MISRISLRTFAILLILFSWVPVVFWSIYTNHQNRQRMVEDARAQALLLVQLTAHQQQLVNDQSRQLLSTIGLFPSVQAADTEHCSEILGLILSQYPIYDNIRVLNREGDVICSALPLVNRQNLSDRIWFQDVLQDPVFQAGYLDINPETNTEVIQQVLPIFAEDRSVQFVAVSSLRIGWFEELLNDVDLPRNAAISAIDGQGTILSRFPDIEGQTGGKITDDPNFQAILTQPGDGSIEANDFTGDLRLYIFDWTSPISTGRIGFVASIPYDSIVAEADRVFFNNLLLQTLVGLGALVVAFAISRTAVWGPVSRLIVRVRNQQRAGAAARLKVQPNEFFQLDAAFDQMVNELEDRQQQFQVLIEHAPMGISLIRNGVRQYANSALARIYGYDSPDQLCGISPIEQLKPEYHDVFQRFLEAAEQHETVNPIELGAVRRDGSLLQVLMQIAVIDTDQGRTNITFVTDITELKRSEAERERLLQQLTEANRQMRLLSQQVIQAHEQERQRLSRELHDEAGQALTAIKISLQLVREDALPEQSQLTTRLEDSIDLTDATIERVRRLAHELRPPGLDTLGIHQTLQSLCRDFSRRTSIPVQYEGLELPGLPDEIGVTLYRILQEALTNVARHAQATQVWVALDYLNERVIMSIKDNGQGISYDGISTNAPRQGIGLIGIRERLETLGGSFYMNSEPGQGTYLKVEIGWEEEPA